MEFGPFNVWMLAMEPERISEPVDAGQVERFMALYSSHQRRLYLYALTLLPSSVDAEDVFQEANLVLWRKFGQYQPDTNFFAWACSVIRYEVLKHREKLTRAATLLDPDVLDRLAQVAAEQVEHLDEFHRRTLVDCTNKLSEADRELMRQRYTVGMAVQTMAQAMRRSPNAVSKSLGRVRRLLLDCMNHSADDPSATGRRTMIDSRADWMELDLLLDRVLDGLETSDDVRQLNQILRIDADACRHYVSYIELHGRLLWGDGNEPHARTGDQQPRASYDSGATEDERSYLTGASIAPDLSAPIHHSSFSIQPSAPAPLPPIIIQTLPSSLSPLPSFIGRCVVLLSDSRRHRRHWSDAGRGVEAIRPAADRHAGIAVRPCPLAPLPSPLSGRPHHRHGRLSLGG